MGAVNGTLAFMVGGDGDSFAQGEKILEPMAGKIIRCGDAGAGQAAKMCNNMVLAATMIVTCEAFELGKRLGLEHQSLFDVMSNASGQSWSTSVYCPVPGPVPASPANKDYQAGFAVSLMNKDLGLALQAAEQVDANTPMGRLAAELYEQFARAGFADLDFSAIIKKLQ